MIKALSILVQIERTKGSTPREVGADMLVAMDSVSGTIGGGHLEFAAIATSRQMLLSGEAYRNETVKLGPDINQCCGGIVDLSFQRFDEAVQHARDEKIANTRSDYPHVLIFGAGHVGKALANALTPLPFYVTLTDSRLDAFGGFENKNIALKPAAMPERLIETAPPNSAFVIMTHDHALDYQIACAALERPDVAYVGVIGSKTKRAVFRSDFLADGGSVEAFERLICPIGKNLTFDKRPQVIAAFVAAELCATLLVPKQNRAES